MLGYLVSGGQVGIEIVFPVKGRDNLDVTLKCEGSEDRQIDAFMVYFLLVRYEPYSQLHTHLDIVMD